MGLLESRGTWTASCDECFAKQALDATSLDDARAAGKRARWFDAARRGKGIAHCAGPARSAGQRRHRAV